MAPEGTDSRRSSAVEPAAERRESAVCVVQSPHAAATSARRDSTTVIVQSQEPAPEPPHGVPADEKVCLGRLEGIGIAVCAIVIPFVVVIVLAAATDSNQSFWAGLGIFAGIFCPACAYCCLMPTFTPRVRGRAQGTLITHVVCAAGLSVVAVIFTVLYTEHECKEDCDREQYPHGCDDDDRSGCGWEALGLAVMMLFFWILAAVMWCGVCGDVAADRVVKARLEKIASEEALVAERMQQHASPLQAPVQGVVIQGQVVEMGEGPACQPPPPVEVATK